MIFEKIEEILMYYADIVGFFDLEFEANISNLLVNILTNQPESNELE